MTQRDVESFADFNQYYQRGYVLDRTDPEKMYYVNGAVDHQRPLRRIMMTSYKNGVVSEGEGLYTENQVWPLVQFGLPNIGMTVFDNQELTYLYYRTARNGVRGFNISRVLMHTFNGFNLQSYGLKRFDKRSLTSPLNAWNALRPKYTPLADAWKDLSSDSPGAIAYALSSKFGVYLSHKEYPTLCYKMFEIGDVIGPNKVRLYTRHAEYREPIRRILNQDMEIEINESR